MCGGTDNPESAAELSEGLSPRVRGNRQPGGDADLPGRSIPACAGEPPRFPTCSFLHPVYPRVCGGTTRVIPDCGHTYGLSPRVRGNRRIKGRDVRGRGSIPACAGEPIWVSLIGYLREVYPRVCGGTTWYIQPPVSQHGLSPRVRGNQDDHLRWHASHGSIPACAGEPCNAGERPIPSAVYPRVCGGTSQADTPRPSRGGLSPRVRGNRAPGH